MLFGTTLVFYRNPQEGNFRAVLIFRECIEEIIFLGVQHILILAQLCGVGVQKAPIHIQGFCLLFLQVFISPGLRKHLQILDVGQLCELLVGRFKLSPHLVVIGQENDILVLTGRIVLLNVLVHIVIPGA